MGALIGWPNLLGVKFEPGLSESEIDGIEKMYKIKFPIDYRLLLSKSLPVSDGFPNWRLTTEENQIEIKKRIDFPESAIIWDIKNNEFWPKVWGKLPNDVIDRVNIFKRFMEKAPKLIPVYSHRYIPSPPYEAGNPIISVYGSDMIFYGEDIDQYFQNEFGKKNMVDYRKIKEIPFWSALVYENDL